MALKAIHNPEDLVWGPEGAKVAGGVGLSGVISKSTQRSYQSEVELVGADGELVDVCYSGAEESITETKYGDEFEHGEVGSGSYAEGIITKVSIQYSNEDASKMVTEKIKTIS